MSEILSTQFLLPNAVGFLFLTIGVGYLYRPESIARIYALLRRVIFNEEHVALHRRKWGLFFLLLSLLSFYYGNFAP